MNDDRWTQYEGPWQVAAGTPGNERFGALLKNFRERSGLSPQQLADQAGVHVSFVRGIERGAQAPSVAKAKPLLACMKEQNRITWLDEPGPDGFVKDSFTERMRPVEPNGPDLVLRDPKIGGDVAFEFKAKVKGQNRRPDVDSASLTTQGMSNLLGALQVLAATTTVMKREWGLGDAAPADAAARPDDALLGRITRMLASVEDDKTLLAVEAYLADVIASRKADEGDEGDQLASKADD